MGSAHLAQQGVTRHKAGSTKQPGTGRAYATGGGSTAIVRTTQKIYIDDILVTVETEALHRDNITGVIYLLEILGFVINHPKSELTPT